MTRHRHDWMRKASNALLLVMLGLYVSAKVHFFLRRDSRDYISEHSVFWLGMVAVVALLWVVAHFSDKEHDASSKDQRG